MSGRARMLCPLDSILFQYQLSTSSCNAPCCRFHPHRQGRLSRMRHFAIVFGNQPSHFIVPLKSTLARGKTYPHSWSQPQLHFETFAMVLLEFIQQTFTDDIRINIDDAALGKYLEVCTLTKLQNQSPKSFLLECLWLHRPGITICKSQNKGSLCIILTSTRWCRIIFWRKTAHLSQPVRSGIMSH